MLHPELRPMLSQTNPPDLSDTELTPLFASVLALPLRGLNKHGAGTPELVTRSVRKVPHVRGFLTEQEIADTPRIGPWLRRLTGRELLAELPDGHGLELTDGGEQFRFGADICARWREVAREATARAQQWARDQYPRPERTVSVRPDRTALTRALSEVVAGHDWPRADARISIVGSRVQAVMTPLQRTGEPHEDDAIPAPSDVLAAAHDYRAACAVVGQGTWFTLDAKAYPDSAAPVTTEWDTEPVWDADVSATIYAEDQAAFPRSHRWLPDWLLQRLEEAHR